MSEQRRHQRIRFSQPPQIRVGQNGQAGQGELQNLSLGGLMLTTEIDLKTGEIFGCEFSVFGSPLIDMPAVVVSRIGKVYSARFQAGPISEILIQGAIDSALASGKASLLSIRDLQGRKVMRIAGGLNSSLSADFMHGLTKGGVAEVDLSAVTDIDSSGLALCLLAVEKYKVKLGDRSVCVDTALRQVARPLQA
jgi:ABC-type transporter Mla MlaB component